MPFDITITLSDSDLHKFQESIDKGKLAVNDQQSTEAIEGKASELIELATLHARMRERRALRTGGRGLHMRIS